MDKHTGMVVGVNVGNVVGQGLAIGVGIAKGISFGKGLLLMVGCGLVAAGIGGAVGYMNGREE